MIYSQVCHQPCNHLLLEWDLGKSHHRAKLPPAPIGFICLICPLHNEESRVKLALKRYSRLWE